MLFVTTQDKVTKSYSGLSVQQHLWELRSPKRKGRNVKEVSKLLDKYECTKPSMRNIFMSELLVVILPRGKVSCAQDYSFWHETEGKHILGRIHSWSLGYKRFFMRNWDMPLRGGHFYIFYCLSVLITTFSRSRAVTVMAKIYSAEHLAKQFWLYIIMTLILVSLLSSNAISASNN